ncbi:hypothetical protein NFI96_008455 [Prochilodus magdalenae]|nr:hypothetical protein NFI96_008455 [Prochilodus magdalenae]
MLRIPDTEPETFTAESDTATGETFTELLTSVCSYTTFPFDADRVKFDHNPQWNFVLDFCSFLKNYETQSGRSVLSALLPVYQSAPAFCNIDLSEGKSSLFLEVLKLQTVKKPVELRHWPYEESEVRSFLQCLPYISQLRFKDYDDDELKTYVLRFLQDLFSKAAECDPATKQSFTELLISMCSERAFPFDGKNSQTEDVYGAQCDFLLDLYSHVKNYETQTGRSVLPALQPVYQSAPVWIIDLSERKSSLLLEVLKLQTEKKSVELWDWSDEESEVRSFLQCLPYISQLSERAFPFDEKNSQTEDICGAQSDFLLDLYSHVKNYETQTGRSVLPALQPVYQSAPVWIIDLSERKSSLLLEVLKLQTEKKPVELRGWSDEESEKEVNGKGCDILCRLASLICKLRWTRSRGKTALYVFYYQPLKALQKEWHLLSLLSKSGNTSLTFSTKVAALLQLLFTSSQQWYSFRISSHIAGAAESDTATGETFTELLTSVCSYTTFPFDADHVKYDPNLYQSAPAFCDIDLSRGKSSLFLEVLKLQTVKKPVELRNWPYKESEVRSFLQCLPYISQLRFNHYDDDGMKIYVLRFLQDLCSKAAECDPATKQSFTELLISMYSERAFPFDEKNSQTEDVYGASPHLHMVQCDFLLDLYSHVKNYESQTGRSVLPALQPVYQSAPAVWIINLSKRKSSILLEVLKLQTEKKPVELRGWSDEESEVRSFLQCLPYISQLRQQDW